jgi:hypothetical protein
MEANFRKCAYMEADFCKCAYMEATFVNVHLRKSISVNVHLWKMTSVNVHFIDFRKLILILLLDTIVIACRITLSLKLHYAIQQSHCVIIKDY